jgi:hypothetical protein
VPDLHQPHDGVLACRLCGSTPAAPGRFRRVQGLVMLMRWASVEGPFCRDCGLALFRHMTAKTLLQGWWGLLSVFASVVAVLDNLVVGRRFGRLATPARHPDAPAPNARPLRPGTPLTRRPATLTAAVPIVLVVAVLMAVMASRAETRDDDVGRCVRVAAPGAAGAADGLRFVDCSGSHDGRIVGEMYDASGPTTCPSGTDTTVRRPDDKLLLCIDADR